MGDNGILGQSQILPSYKDPLTTLYYLRLAQTCPDLPRLAQSSLY